MVDLTKWIVARPDERAVEVGRRSLEGRLLAVEYYLPLAAHSWREQSEHLHQLRVWSRRAQVALDLYRGLVPERRALWMEKQLKRTRSRTNAARDADVFAARLAADLDRRGAAKLLERVTARRHAAQRPLMELECRLRHNDRFARRISKLLTRVRLRGDFPPGAQPSLAEWSSGHYARVTVPFLRLARGDLSDLKTLHQCRIAGKHVRYAMELLGGAMPEEARVKAYEHLSELQDQLGAINDHAAAENWILHWLEEDNLKQKLTGYLSELLEHERTLLVTARQAFQNWWTVERCAGLQRAFELAEYRGGPVPTEPRTAASGS